MGELKKPLYRIHLWKYELESCLVYRGAKLLIFFPQSKYKDCRPTLELNLTSSGGSPTSLQNPWSLVWTILFLIGPFLFQGLHA